MDVGDWLRNLGLGQYENTFRENDIDLEVLPELTEADFEKVGVSLGHRKRLLKAIAGIKASHDEPKAALAASAPVGDAAERRQLTVMFCDLVGSTAMSARLDPEDMRAILGAYHKCCATLITSNGGFVAKYMGGGVLAYFGYPQAHEHDAEHAVRAGLAIVEGAPKLQTVIGTPLHVRVGTATGIVVVGDLLGSGELQERGVVGDTPNLAARLQGLAKPDSVVIAEGTRKLLGNLFELDDLGPQDLKGVAGPTRAFAPLRESSQESRFEALHAGGLTAMVGREEEADLLLRRWSKAKAGEGQLVLLSGEPGIGKSRLTAALHERLRGAPHVRMRYFCSPQHSDSALYPFIAQLERAAGFARDDTTEMRLDKFERLHMPAAPPPEELALLAELLSLPTTRYPELQLSPPRKKARTFAALLRQLAELARRQPLLIVFEDLHWIDPSSRELLDLIVERAANLPALLILTFRPEFQPPWSGLPQVTTLALNRLDPRTGAEMIAGIAGDRPLPTELAAEIVVRADGVPLFVEELARAFIEAGGSGAGVDRALLGAPPPSAGVPAALNAPLMARLDRLGPAAREVAQIGAVIGRDFSYGLLAPIAGRGDSDLADALDRLTASGLVFRRGAPPEATFLFKHALVRDTAYASLPRRRRQELHAQIAGLLETGFPDIIEAQPELLAQHFAAAGLTEQAVAYWQRAGERAVARSANIEAAAHFGRGIAILEVTAGRHAARRTGTRAASRSDRSVTEEPGTWILGDRVRRCSRARNQPACRRGHTSAFLGLVRLGAGFRRAGTPRPAREVGEEALGVAARLQDPEVMAYGHANLGNIVLFLGEWVEARTHLERAIALYDPNWGRTATFRVGLHFLFFRAVLGRVLWHLGYPDQALHANRQAIAAAEESAHPFTMTDAFQWAAVLHQLRREVAPAMDAADAVLTLANEHIFPFLAAHATALHGWALVQQGRGEEGIDAVRQGIDADRRTGANLEDFALARPARRSLRQDRQDCGGAARDRRGARSCRKNRRRLLRGGAASVGRRIAPRLRSRRDTDGRSLFPARYRNRPRAAGEILGIARRDEPRPAVARSRPAHASPRPPRARLRLVHRGLRHARPQRGQGPARRTCVMRALAISP